MGCGASAQKSKYEDKAIASAALGRKASREILPDELPGGDRTSSGSGRKSERSRPSVVDFKNVVEVVEAIPGSGDPEPQPEQEPKEEVVQLDGAAKPKPERQITTFARSGDDDEDEDEEEEEAATGTVEFEQKVVVKSQEQVDGEIEKASKTEPAEAEAKPVAGATLKPPTEPQEMDEDTGKPVKRLSKTRERVPTCHFKKGGPGGAPFSMDDILDSSDEEVGEDEVDAAAEGELPAEAAPDAADA